MKTTQIFKDIIWNYLLERAESDEQLMMRLEKKQKNIDACVAYILNQVRQSGRSGFADEEIFSMALHYYDEDDLGDIKPISCDIIVNQKIELTEEEKAEAKRKALLRYEEEEFRKLKKNSKSRKEKQLQIVENTLFDFENESKN